MTAGLTIKAWQGVMPKFYPVGMARRLSVCYPSGMEVTA
jgi:hypothetical protein